MFMCYMAARAPGECGCEAGAPAERPNPEQEPDWCQAKPLHV
ncbi:hypothetical protein EYF80_062414 [Liparis tanakae]|uniref:Uncharacterized protein n=1 Tax=Liparis tanakae TaxID=230148 RepID=A0A4Z2EGJ3_9TELE|nr:hypothetical protein EYF80_062414 [Liparis tanakae]